MARRISFRVVLEAATESLKRAGVSDGDAQTIAAVLLEAEARGYPSQGLMRLHEIETFLEKELLDPRADIQIVRSGPSIALFHAGGAIGHPVAVRAIDEASEMALRHGVGLAGVRGAGHIGYLTHYVERAARRGLLAVATTISAPAVSFPDSAQKLLGTNPVAYAFLSDGALFCADSSLAAASRGEVIARRDGASPFSAPVGYSVDGRPTSVPQEILDGAIAPIGFSIRGFFVNFLFSLLAGPLIGGVANHEVKGTRWPDGKPNKGDFFMCIDPERFGDAAAFRRNTGAFLRQALAFSDTFHIPGETSRARLDEALANGIRIDDADLRAKLGL